MRGMIRRAERNQAGARLRSESAVPGLYVGGNRADLRPAVG